MRKCDKKRIKKIRAHEKARRLDKRIARLSLGGTADYSHYYEILSTFSTGNIKFLSDYAFDNKLSLSEHYYSALETLLLERSAQLQKEGKL